MEFGSNRIAEEGYSSFGRRVSVVCSLQAARFERGFGSQISPPNVEFYKDEDPSIAKKVRAENVCWTMTAGESSSDAEVPRRLPKPLARAKF